MGIGAKFSRSLDALGKVPTVESDVYKQPSNPAKIHLQSQTDREPFVGGHIPRSESGYHSLISALKHSRVTEEFGVKPEALFGQS
jgi:hypothetical protein